MADRNYSSGTEKGLFLLSRGYCYMPDCPRHVFAIEGGEPSVMAQIAHIHGLNEGSARYIQLDSRKLNAFGNLILLCKPHHDLVDKKENELRYPAELLIRWKRDREGASLEVLAGLEGVTEKKLTEWMANAVTSVSKDLKVAIQSLGDTVSQDIIDALTPLISQAFEFPYLNSDDIEVLGTASRALTEFAPHVESLSFSSTVLNKLSWQVEVLQAAGSDLRHVAEVAESLGHSADQLRNLPDTADHLSAAVHGLDLDVLSNVASRMKNATSDERIYSFENAISRADEVARSLQAVASSWSSEDSDVADDGVDRAKVFLAGLATGLVLVTITVAIVAYLILHK